MTVLSFCGVGSGRRCFTSKSEGDGLRMRNGRIDRITFLPGQSSEVSSKG